MFNCPTDCGKRYTTNKRERERQEERVGQRKEIAENSTLKFVFNIQ